MDHSGAVQQLTSTLGLDEARASELVTAAEGEHIDLDFYVQYLTTGDNGESPLKREGNVDVLVSDAADRFKAEASATPAGSSGSSGSGSTPASKSPAQVVKDAVAGVPDNATPSDIQAAIGSSLAQFGASSVAPPQALFDMGIDHALDPNEINRAIEIYNLDNPGHKITPGDTSALYIALQGNIPGVIHAVGQAVEDLDPGKSSFSVWNGNAGKMEDVGVKRSDLNVALQAHPITAPNIKGVIAAAHRAGSNVPWQLLSAAGTLLDTKPVTAKGTPTGGAGQATSAGPGQAHEVTIPDPSTRYELVNGQWVEKSGGPGDPIKVQRSSSEITPTAGGSGSFQLGAGLEKALAPGKEFDAVAGQLKQGLAKYGDQTLALIALKDPALADAIYEQGGVTSDQARQVKQILLDASYDPDTMAKMGLAVDVPKYLAATNPDAGGGAKTVALPDPKALESGARAMYQAWFVREPTPDELSAFVAAIDSQVVSAAKKATPNPFKGGQSVSGDVTATAGAPDPNAQLDAMLRQAPDYARLFGQKPIGTSETDYANQFRSAGGGLLGGQLANPDAIRTGMQTGNVQDTLQSIQGDAKSWQNSTFMQRAARAAEAIAQVT